VPTHYILYIDNIVVKGLKIDYTKESIKLGIRCYIIEYIINLD
jgi:hypothetical protein